MQFKTVATLLAFTLASLAQDLSQVPKCAITPALAAFGKTGCALTDIKCVCSSTGLVADLESAIAKACSAEELATVNAFAVSTCQKAGVTLVIPGYSGGSNSSSGSTSASSTSTSGSATGTSTVSTSATSESSAVTSAAVSTSASTSTSGSTSVSQTASSTSSTVSPGAANALQIGGSAVFGAVLAALML